MKISQEKEFKPLTITIENKAEYIAFVQIIDEANSVASKARIFMDEDAVNMSIELSDYFTNDV